MAIHNDFADWYRAASITPSADLLEARWQGVESAVGSLDPAHLIPLLRLFALQPPPEFSAPAFLDAPFRAADATFPNRDNIVELRILSGAILRRVIETDHRLAVVAALGLLSSSFGPRQASVILPDHLEAARAYLASKSRAIRTMEAAPSIKIPAITKERLEELLPVAAFGTNQTPGLRDPIIGALNEENTRLNTGLNRLSSALWQLVQVQREELNMLWWLQTRVSRDLNVPFSTLGPQAPIILAKELSDLTVFVPGPSAILGMILASMEITEVNDRQVSILSAVNGCPRGWREKLSNGTLELGELCPVSLALAKSLETDGEMDWLPVYHKQCDIKADTTVSSVALANQVYIERLLIRAFAGLKK